jgi:hypothetical protein
MTSEPQVMTGPLLFLDAVQNDVLRLSVLFIAANGEHPEPIETVGGIHAAKIIAKYDHAVVWRVRFDLPANRSSCYAWSGQSYSLASDFRGDIRIAYVSCNGEQIGDLEREGSERNAMWARLTEDHRNAPFSLLLHGGDQVYADQVTEGHPLSEDWPEHIPKDPSRADLADLRHHLRERFLERYVALYRAPEFVWIAARVPSLMQWDDHDICDGWGSLPRSKTYTPVGQILFDVARESFLTFQHAAVDGDLPERFHDPAGLHLGWSVCTAGLRLLAPDMRSERTRHAVMGDGGWKMIRAEASTPVQGHTFLMSSVPLLGPRLSVFEALMVAIPKMQKYEDDLRDQWQSRAHRDEWCDMLRVIRDMALANGHDVTVLSGEIHLATRATMKLGAGRWLHQLVASGIAHRAPPRVWARILGALAQLGESPLKGCPIQIPYIPGQKSRYIAERNYLMLERSSDIWRARWALEESGITPPLIL